MKKLILTFAVLLATSAAQAEHRPSLSPTSLTFASQTVGTTSAAQIVTLKNIGNASLSITSIGVSGNFAETNNCGSTLAVSASCTVSVTFTPTATGTRKGAISFTDNGASSPQKLSLSGTAVAASPALTVTSSSLPNGTVGTAYSTTLTAANGTAPYTWSDPACSGSCNTGMNFGSNGVLSGTPANAGTSTFTFAVVDSKGNTATKQLSIAITAAATAPIVSLSPTSLTFASQTVATTSAAQSVTLTNTGNATLSISSLAASGSFAETNNCGSSLAANTSCTVSVTFTPTATGTLTGAISFTDNGASSPQKVSLSGTAVAVAAPVVSLSPTSLTFASQTVATTSAAQAVTLTNTGNAALSISSLAASGSFAETNNCGSSLAASASCTISVTFKPTASGTLTGGITLTDNAASSPQAVSLTGTAVATVQPQVTLSWTESSTSVTGYNVYRSTQSGTGYTEINLSLVPSQSYVDTTVSAGQTYYYVVTAVNASGQQSAYSAQVSAPVPAS